jgi:hypothetical protein
MKKLIIVLLSSLFLLGCAVFNNPSEQLEMGKVLKVYVRPSGNLTNQFGIDMEFMIAFTNDLLRDGRITFVNLESEADAIISLSIRRYVTEPLTYDANMNIEQYKLSVSIRYSVFDAQTKEVLMNNSNMTAIQIYRSSLLLSNSISNQADARALVWDKLSRGIIRDIVKWYSVPLDKREVLTQEESERIMTEIESEGY